MLAGGDGVGGRSSSGKQERREGVYLFMIEVKMKGEGLGFRVKYQKLLLGPLIL